MAGTAYLASPTVLGRDRLSRHERGFPAAAGAWACRPPGHARGLPRRSGRALARPVRWPMRPSARCLSSSTDTRSLALRWWGFRSGWPGPGGPRDSGTPPGADRVPRAFAGGARWRPCSTSATRRTRSVPARSSTTAALGLDLDHARSAHGAGMACRSPRGGRRPAASCGATERTPSSTTWASWPRALAVVGFVRFRRDPRVVALAVAGAIALVASLGPSVKVAGGRSRRPRRRRHLRCAGGAWASGSPWGEAFRNRGRGSGSHEGELSLVRRNPHGGRRLAAIGVVAMLGCEAPLDAGPARPVLGLLALGGSLRRTCPTRWTFVRPDAGSSAMSFGTRSWHH